MSEIVIYCVYECVSDGTVCGNFSQMWEKQIVAAHYYSMK
jgi:hypothetical protein